MPEVSVIVPVYNTEKYLRRCVDSILAQTFTNFELILVDDGSTDSSSVICDEYSVKDPRVRVFHQNNQGQAAARNYALEKARGDFVSFVDSDDFVHVRFLELCYGAAICNEADICCCCAKVGISDGNDFITKEINNIITEHLEISDWNLKSLFLSKEYLYGVVWGKVIKKAIVSQHMFTPGRIYEDSAIVCKWLCEAKYVIKLSAEMYYYYENSESTIRGSFSLKHLDILWSLEEQRAFYKEVGFSQMYSTLMAQFLVSSASCYYGLKRIKETKKANEVRKELVHRLMERGALDSLNDSQRKYVLDCLFPRIMEGYYVINAQLKKRSKLFRK